MSLPVAVRRLQFCAAHRLFGHEGKCATVHGHNYVVFFHAEGTTLDAVGRVIDFSVLKEKLGHWIDENWDHTFIACKEDIRTIELLRQVPGSKPIFILEGNPTAENMANELLHKVGPTVLAGTGVRLIKVVLWETENCFVEASL